MIIRKYHHLTFFHLCHFYMINCKQIYTYNGYSKIIIVCKFLYLVFLYDSLFFILWYRTICYFFYVILKYQKNVIPLDVLWVSFSKKSFSRIHCKFVCITFFGQKILLDTKLFWAQNFLGTQIFLGPIIFFLSKRFHGP